MKKKIRDLTVGEVSEFCNNNSCTKCFLFRFSEMCAVSFDLSVINSHVKSILDQEIEIPDEVE